MINTLSSIDMLNSIGNSTVTYTNRLSSIDTLNSIGTSTVTYVNQSLVSPMTLANEFRELVAKDKDVRLKSEATYDVQYPTGFMDLDYNLGQKIVVYDNNGNAISTYDSIGIVDGSINMVVGRTGCGKSTFCKQSAGNIVRPFRTASIFEDSIEGGITGKRNEVLLNMTPEEVHNRLHMRNDGITSESFFKRFKTIHDIKMQKRDDFLYDTGKCDSRGIPIYKLEPTVYILDSLAVLVPEKLAEEEEVSGQMSTTAAAKLLARIFRTLVAMCKEANIILFTINHITDDVSINPMQKKKAQTIYLDQGETTPGGRTPFYLSNNVFRIEDSRKTKEMEALGVTGVFADICVLKSRTSVAKRDPVCTLIFEQERGFNPMLSLLISLKSYDMIGGAGAYLYLKGHEDIKFSQKKFLPMLVEKPDFYQAFIHTCASVFSNALHERDNVEVIDAAQMNLDIMKAIFEMQS